MSVYVDSVFEAVPKGAQARRCGTRWCHMIADTPEELHAMAQRIGMRREWFQPKSFPHYDLVPRRRAAAVAFGAVEVDRRTLALKMLEIRGRMNPGFEEIRAKLVAAPPRKLASDWPVPAKRPA